MRRWSVCRKWGTGAASHHCESVGGCWENSKSRNPCRTRRTREASHLYEEQKNNTQKNRKFRNLEPKIVLKESKKEFNFVRFQSMGGWWMVRPSIIYRLVQRILVKQKKRREHIGGIEKRCKYEGLRGFKIESIVSLRCEARTTKKLSNRCQGENRFKFDVLWHKDTHVRTGV